ncbi:aromatic prenyltransferase [Stachybotrys elegans]|uniref:Aromatic prenyltransferase n=1 Tax=Stachybotrys elegans TaxID=80388 RepID=A0A8K0WL58_9HYPO|nr:aromatic prenyltransferase [Stachybotrys elegans]
MDGDSDTFLRLDSLTPASGNENGSRYWWESTGRDLANMLRAANYPQQTQHQFLSYYKNFLCPLLGGAISNDNESHMRSWTWDGSTHEYSFELKGSMKTPEVRFVGDFSQLRPVNWTDPLSSAKTDQVLATLATRIPGFDDTWYKSLKDFLGCSHLPSSTQKELVVETGHASPILVGFDIFREAPQDSNMLPALGKVYFLPCFAAAAKNTTRFQIIRAAICQLPTISSKPNILSSLALIEEYLASKSEDWENGARFLSTDLLSSDQTRLKLYFRCPDSHFETIWDYFTLGGRIPGLQDAKSQYRDFIEFLTDEAVGNQVRSSRALAGGIETGSRRKMTTIYFSLDNKNPYPAPKVAFCARNFAANDAQVARGLDRWLGKYGWDDCNKSIEEYIRHAM